MNESCFLPKQGRAAKSYATDLQSIVKVVNNFKLVLQERIFGVLNRAWKHGAGNRDIFYKGAEKGGI
jgi:hypothetical protein